VQRLHPSALRGTIYCILFAAATFYIEARIRPQVLYYWNPELFPATLAFFRDIALLPGGLTTYADKFLFQLNALPWLGALSTASLALLSGIFCNCIHSTLTRTRSSLFTIVPLFFVLCTLDQFRIIPQAKLLSTLAFADVFTRLPARNAFLRTLVFFIASCLFLLIVQDLYWLFAALCVLSEIPRPKHRWGGVVYTLLAFVLLRVDHRFLYLVNTKIGDSAARSGILQGRSHSFA
jgi:hypothetical protein